MKAFLFQKKIKHIAHEGFVEKNKHNMCLAKASAKKFVVLIKKMSVEGRVTTRWLISCYNTGEDHIAPLFLQEAAIFKKWSFFEPRESVNKKYKGIFPAKICKNNKI